MVARSSGREGGPEWGTSVGCFATSCPNRILLPPLFTNCDTARTHDPMSKRINRRKGRRLGRDNAAMPRTMHPFGVNGNDAARNRRRQNVRHRRNSIVDKT